ncbi:MAG: ATP-binding protein [Candidatus Aenigmarchaeota archaeon]|nr:ATP-binding protein [Candidatus Aenigmarchaeota archaeon]
MIIAVTGGKGGVGKSMVATSLAVELGKKTKTMLIDADAECPNDHLLLNVKRKKYKDIKQMIPKWNRSKCTKCGKCALVCKQNAIVFVKNRYPAFVKDVCIGCGACMVSCPNNAIGKSKKIIGSVYTGRNYKILLVSGELKLGELASGEVVAELRKNSQKIDTKKKHDFVLIDSAAGIGCPVIASITGTDFVIAVTEPTPSALHDMKRVLYLADHFKIDSGIVINKCNIDKKFCSKIEDFAKKKKIPILGKIPYRKDFIKSTVSMKPVSKINKKYSKIFNNIIEKIHDM